MKEINIYKAQRNNDDQIPESVTIIIKEETPDIPFKSSESIKMFEKRAHTHYKEQGEKLGKALLVSLPGGTVDELLIFLLEYRKSILKVTYIE